MTDVKPFDLRHAGNEIHLVSSVLRKISEQAGQRFENHVSHLLNCDATITTEVTLEHDLLHANADARHFRNWIIVDNDINDLSVARVSRSLASAFTDLTCGGTGTSITRTGEDRPLTSEGRVLTMMVKHLLDELAFAYNALAPTTLRLASNKEATEAEHRQTYKPAFLCCMNFHLQAGKSRGTLSVLYPTSQFSSDTYFSDGHSHHDRLSALKQRMLDIKLPVTAILTSQETSLADMLELKAGDIIPLDDIADAEILIGNKRLGTASILTDGQSILARISSITR